MTREPERGCPDCAVSMTTRYIGGWGVASSHDKEAFHPIRGFGRGGKWGDVVPPQVIFGPMLAPGFCLAEAGHGATNSAMSQTADRIPEDIKAAMRAKDSTSLNALRALKSALTNAAIEKGGLGTELDEPEVLAVVRKQIKQRVDACEQFEKAGRPELAATEKTEIEILSRYLPAALTADEMESIVNQSVIDTGATGKADMGKVMKRAQELADGRADGKLLSAAVMKCLA